MTSRPITYGSVCSGIEAASVAWKPLGWRCAFVSEIEKFPCAVLAHHYPDVKNLGDLTRYKEWQHEPIDLLVGGTPCQSFSVAGLRKGLDDPRGNLALVFLGLVDRARPRWVVWENVPGVLYSKQGRDFGAFLGALGQLGYGWSYRVLDAQYFGLAQRRRRVFVVGHLGSWQRAAAVLLEPESLRGDPAPSREAGARVAGAAQARTCRSVGAEEAVNGHLTVYPLQEVGKREAKDQNGVGIGLGGRHSPMFTLQAGAQHGVAVTHPLRAEGCDASEDGTGRGIPLTLSPTLTSANDPFRSPQSTEVTAQVEAVHASGFGVRRLTPRECERLQGFPTRIDRVIIQPCYERAGTRLVRAVLRCLSVQSDALPAAERESGVDAWCADATFWNGPEGLAAAVAVHVRSSHAPKVLRALSRGRWRWSASDAGSDATFPLSTRPDAFARAVAALLPVLARATRDGRAESLLSINGSTPPASGRSLVVTFGPESEVAASDVPARLGAATKSIMSESGPDSQPCGLNARTLLSCVCLATSGFTARPTPTDPSSAIVLDLESDYTAIPGAKDSPRYRALGNSMAVPCMRWIGERIQAVDAIVCSGIEETDHA